MFSHTCVEEQPRTLPGLEVEGDVVVGREDGVDAALGQVVGQVLAAAERRLGGRVLWKGGKIEGVQVRKGTFIW